MRFRESIQTCLGRMKVVEGVAVTIKDVSFFSLSSVIFSNSARKASFNRHLAACPLEQVQKLHRRLKRFAEQKG